MVDISVACFSHVVNYPRNVPPDAPTQSIRPRSLPALITAALGGLLISLSVVYPSTSRLDVWPWAAFAAIGWAIPIIVAVCRIACGRPDSRFDGAVDAGFALLALAAVASSLASPLGGAVRHHLLPTLGALALPYALLPAFGHERARLSLRTLATVAVAILAVGLLQWSPPSRNALPFGHANITGSVAVLSAALCVLAALRETGRTARALFIAGSLVSIVAALSSHSRGAVIALAIGSAVSAAIALLGRRRFGLFALLVMLIAAGAIASNSRLRELALHGRWSNSASESNAQRTAMMVGGLRLGLERPLLGWGAGSIPHAFPRVRSDLPGTADNFLQLHNTPVQLWATLGASGLIGATIAGVGTVRRARRASWTAERIALAGSLTAGGTALLFDHPFDTPIFTVLAAALLCKWLRELPESACAQTSRFTFWKHAGLAVISIGILGFSLFATARDLAARRAYDQALDLADRGDAVGYTDRLRLADMLSPDDPYYAHLLAAQLTTGHPFPAASGASPRTAVALLERTLETNPDLEYAHYNLGWLLLGSDPEAAVLHFAESIRLAPKRGGVYLGLGLARIRLEDTTGAIRAFAAEWLLDPATAWTSDWTQGPLVPLAPQVRALATAAARPLNHGNDPWAKLSTPAPAAQPYRRLRTGYGVLMGHPDGAPPVDFNIRTRAELPPEVAETVPPFGWIDAGALLDFLRSN